MRNLKELRESLGMSQHDVAVKLDVTDVAVSRWECGRSNPLRKYRERMANIYGVSVQAIECLLSGCTIDELLKTETHETP